MHDLERVSNVQRLINESETSTTVSELCAEYRANNVISKDTNISASSAACAIRMVPA